MLIGAALVFFLFPKRDEERKLLMEYQQQDIAEISVAGPAPLDAVPAPSKG